MILVTRLNGPGLAINADLIQRVESTPDTVVTLVDGTKFVVAESVEDIICRFREFQASVIAASNQLHNPVPHPGPTTLRVLSGPED